MTYTYVDAVIWAYIFFVIIAGIWLLEYLRERFRPPRPVEVPEYIEVSTNLWREK
jgi:hypothetical protein